MALNAILLANMVVIIADSLTRVNSVPVIVDSSDLWQPYSRPEDLNSVEPEAYPIDVEEMRDLLTPLTMQRRSIEPKITNDAMLSNLRKRENDEDDLETAAGTNILRPLFVYRQQLAYRERIRKAGRRSVPNF